MGQVQIIISRAYLIQTNLEGRAEMTPNAMTARHWQVQVGAWGAVTLPMCPGQSPGGDPGFAPEAPEVLHFTVLKNGLKIHICPY